MQRRRARGFTLVEVLVALIIVAFGMSAVLLSLGSAADTVGRLRDKSLAEWIAFNQISTARLALTAPASGTTTGALDYANGKWAWSQEISALDIPGILRITVKVRRDDGSGAPSPDQPVDWLATAIGFRGDALNASSGANIWNGVQIAGGTGAAGTTTGTTTANGTTGNGDDASTAERSSGPGGDRPPGGRNGGPGPPGTPANPGNGQ